MESCPFLDEQNQKCKATIWRILDTAGTRHADHRPILDHELPKCRTLWKTCPDYLSKEASR